MAEGLIQSHGLRESQRPETVPEPVQDRNTFRRRFRLTWRKRRPAPEPVTVPRKPYVPTHAASDFERLAIPPRGLSFSRNVHQQSVVAAHRQEQTHGNRLLTVPLQGCTDQTDEVALSSSALSLIDLYISEPVGPLSDTKNDIDEGCHVEEEETAAHLAEDGTLGKTAESKPQQPTEFELFIARAEAQDRAGMALARQSLAQQHAILARRRSRRAQERRVSRTSGASSSAAAKRDSGYHSQSAYDGWPSSPGQEKQESWAALFGLPDSSREEGALKQTEGNRETLTSSTRGDGPTLTRTIKSTGEAEAGKKMPSRIIQCLGEYIKPPPV